MSRGDGRALDEKAVEAAVLAYPDVAPMEKRKAWMRDAVSAYLDALLSELPEHALEAAGDKAYDHVQNRMNSAYVGEQAICAFLLAKTDEG